MKILMLGWELPPHNSGGLGVACYQLCKALAARGTDINFILPYDAPHQTKFMKITPALPLTPQEIQLGVYDSASYRESGGSQGRGSDLFGQLKVYESAVEQLAAAEEFDVIHAHDWLTFRAGLKAKQISGRPLILHVHSIERDRAGGGEGHPLVREIEGLCMLLADRIVAVSELTKQMIVKDYGIPADRIIVAHNSIDIDELDLLDGANAYHYLEMLRSQGYRVVTNIGRITIQKGLANLLRAGRDVVARMPKTIFLIVGSGEQLYELMELAAELGIGKNVVFTGFERGKRWRDAFAIADLFLMPSISEPFGLTPLEAAFYGTPSLISKQSGVSEILRNCLKVDFWDTHEMANQIVAVLQNPALQEELRDNVVSELKHLSWDAAARTLVNVYFEHAPHKARQVVV